MIKNVGVIKILTKKVGAFFSSLLLVGFFQCSESSSDNSTLFLLLNYLSIIQSLENHTNTLEDQNPPIYPNVSLFNKITEAPGATYTGFGDPNKAINGVRGAGKMRGSLDVYSLNSSPTSSYCIPNERCIVLEIENKKAVNGPGIDFMVFENGFCRINESNCGISHFIESVIVEVSYDGINWCGWNPQYIRSDTSAPNTQNPNNWLRFAGIWPVLYHQDTWTYSEDDIFDREKAGGDGFDLSDPEFGNSGNGCTSSVKNQILRNGFIYLRLISANSRGFTFAPGSFDQKADIDGAIARYVTDR